MGELVCIQTLLNRTEAETIKSFLEANGIAAMLDADDIGGMQQGLSMRNGIKVLVRNEDKATALALIKKGNKSDSWFETKKREEREKAARMAPATLLVAILTLIAAIGVFWGATGDDRKAVGFLFAFVSFVFWGVWIAAILHKRE